MTGRKRHSRIELKRDSKRKIATLLATAKSLKQETKNNKELKFVGTKYGQSNKDCLSDLSEIWVLMSRKKYNGYDKRKNQL